jgi:hypothetical protein
MMAGRGILPGSHRPARLIAASPQHNSTAAMPQRRCLIARGEVCHGAQFRGWAAPQAHPGEQSHFVSGALRCGLRAYSGVRLSVRSGTMLPGRALRRSPLEACGAAGTGQRAAISNSQGGILARPPARLGRYRACS